MGNDEGLRSGLAGFAGDATDWDLLPLLEHLHDGRDDKVQVIHSAQLERGVSEVDDVQVHADGNVTIKQHVFGLVDSASPLPEAYIDLAVREANSERGGPWLDLVDSVTEPFVLSDWRAWRHRFAGFSDGQAFPPAAAALGRSSGDESVQSALAAAGYFAHGVFSCGVLATAVSNLLDADCKVEEFDPEWIALADSDHRRLGMDLRLGESLLGTRALTVDGSATVHIKSGRWEDVEDLLRHPRESRLGRLLSIASEGRISWTVNLTAMRIPASTRSHRSEDEPRVEIALGVSSWLTSSLNMPSDYNCSVRLPQFGAWTGD